MNIFANNAKKINEDDLSSLTRLYISLLRLYQRIEEEKSNKDNKRV